MATINPSGLYSQNEGIFNARPYVQHEEQLQAHQEAKDQANEDFYRNLPNTINDKGLRDIDVPGVNQARNNLSQYFIQNKKSILKGNTAESYNYQKQIRDLQGNVQEGLNASKISNQIAGYKLDRTKADMFYGPEKDEDQRLHNLSVFDPNRKGIDLTNFTAAPKTWDDADELARKNYMGTYKASSFEPKTRILDPNDPTKDQIVSHPVFTDGQFNQMKLKSLYDYNGKLSYKNMVDKISADPAQKAILGQIYQEYNKGAAPVSQSDYAFATDLAKLTAPVQKESEVTNGQRRIDAANAENNRRASRNQGYKQANIAANKNNLPQASQGNAFDDATGNVAGKNGRPDMSFKKGLLSDKDGNLYTGNDVEMDKVNIPAGVINNSKKSGQSFDRVPKVRLEIKDGQIMSMYHPQIGTINRSDQENNQNNKVSKTAVPAKYGNATRQEVPDKQKIKKGKYD